MSLEAIEFLIVVIAALLIVGSIIEMWKMAIRHAEIKRERFLEETRAHRWRDDAS